LCASTFIDDTPLKSPPIHALSLAIAQKCNLACTYCYASQGEFGGQPKDMPWDIARRAVDLLLDQAKPGMRLNLAFLGGEPLSNRSVFYSATEYASERARSCGATISFSITTNGTLVSAEDAVFFDRHAFAVTVSLDGLRETHNVQRPFKGGGGTFDRIMSCIRPLLDNQKRMQVSVRATVVSSQSMRLREAL